MKKIFALSLVLFMSLSTFAQRVKTDYVKNDVRTITLDEQNLYRKMFSAASLAMDCYIGQHETAYSLNLVLNEDGVEIKKGSMLALKFEDGSIMELSCARDCTYDLITENNHLYKYTSPNYMLTQQQAEKIAKANVVKIRIENTGDYLDVDIKRNKMSNYFTKALSNINAVLAQGPKNKLSDF